MHRLYMTTKKHIIGCASIWDMTMLLLLLSTTDNMPLTMRSRMLMTLVGVVDPDLLMSKYISLPHRRHVIGPVLICVYVEMCIHNPDHPIIQFCLDRRDELMQVRCIPDQACETASVAAYAIISRWTSHPNEFLSVPKCISLDCIGLNYECEVSNLHLNEDVIKIISCDRVISSVFISATMILDKIDQMKLITRAASRWENSSGLHYYRYCDICSDEMNTLYIKLLERFANLPYHSYLVDDIRIVEMVPNKQKQFTHAIGMGHYNVYVLSA